MGLGVQKVPRHENAQSGHGPQVRVAGQDIISGRNVMNTASDVGPAPGSFWTSGTDQGRQGTYAWCSARRLFYKSKWASGQPANSAQAQCVAVRLDAQTARIEKADFATPRKFICEVISFVTINKTFVHPHLCGGDFPSP